MGHEPERLGTRARAFSHPGRGTAAAGKPAEARALPAEFLRPGAGPVCAAVPARDLALRHEAGGLRRAQGRGRGTGHGCEVRTRGNDRGGVPRGLRRRVQHRAPGARHRHDRHANAHLHHQRDLPLRRAGEAPRQAAGLPVHLHRARRHVGDARGDQRPRPVAFLPRGRRGKAHADRGGTAPGHRAGHGARVRFRDPLGAALGTPPAGGRQLRQSAGLHRRRRRTPDLAHRRVRHEYRHPGFGEPRVETRGLPARMGRAGAAALL